MNKKVFAIILQPIEAIIASMSSSNRLRIKGIGRIGLFQVIDGSLFPTLIQMSGSVYRKAKNAFKLHLSFELNRMIATEFLIGSGKSSERAFLDIHVALLSLSRNV